MSQLDLLGTPPRGEAAQTDNAQSPLAEQLRPQGLDDVLGQDHLLGSGGAIRALLDANALTSLLLWGPPGSGKTTIARLLAAHVGLRFEQISAVFSGVADLKKVFEGARASSS